MKYEVFWRPEAEEALVRLWSEAVDSAPIAHAATEIYRELEDHPHTAGESRDGSYRLVIVLPLVARYVIDDIEKVVTVTAIWSASSE
jgi:hypothetical protein